MKTHEPFTTATDCLFRFEGKTFFTRLYGWVKFEGYDLHVQEYTKEGNVWVKKSIYPQMPSIVSWKLIWWDFQNQEEARRIAEEAWEEKTRRTNQ